MAEELRDLTATVLDRNRAQTVEDQHPHLA
jgi:hypothetical protein